MFSYNKPNFIEALPRLKRFFSFLFQFLDVKWKSVFWTSFWNDKNSFEFIGCFMLVLEYFISDPIFTETNYFKKVVYGDESMLTPYAPTGMKKKQNKTNPNAHIGELSDGNNYCKVRTICHIVLFRKMLIPIISMNLLTIYSWVVCSLICEIYIQP